MYQEALEVLKKIELHGFKAYIVGGFPRDLYIGIENKDIDICTSAKPNDVMKIFDVKSKSGIKYGSIIINYKSNKYEITTFRKEKKYKNNRVPVDVQYINSLKEDLYRRDFIINTLCINSSGQFVDLLNAKYDIDNKIINSVGDNNKKIKEDSLRILRAIRFATILNFKLSNELENAIKKNKSTLKKLSYERKKQELDKIFSSKNVLYGLSLLKELGIMNELNLNDISVNITEPIGIWIQLDSELKYPYTNEEKRIIKSVKKLLQQDLNDKYVLYKNNIRDLQIAYQIKNMPVDMLKYDYENLVIKNRKDIKILPYKICEILKIEKRTILKEIYINLEKNILNKAVENNEKSIKQFLIREYKK